RLDSNQRPPEPHSGALAKLRHAPRSCPSWTCAYCYHVLSAVVKPAPSAARDRIEPDANRQSCHEIRQELHAPRQCRCCKPIARTSTPLLEGRKTLGMAEWDDLLSGRPVLCL